MTDDATTIPSWSDLLADPDEERLASLTTRLAALDGPADEDGGWPQALWEALVENRVPLWSISKELGGEGSDRLALLQRYARVAEGSLTAAFILSQHDAGVRRLAAAGERAEARRWLSKIAEGTAFTTVGISHLTTSRRLGSQPMTAVEVDDGFQLNGAMPWVTAAVKADVIVTGAPLPDGRQILVAVPTDRPGLVVRPPFRLAALEASCTGEVGCEGVHVAGSDLLAGPVIDVMSQPGAAGTGGLETTALALGQARAALAALAVETPHRNDLAEPVEALGEAWHKSWVALVAAAQGLPGAPTPGQVRGQANALVLRASQAFLTTRKGSGFLRTEPAQRWARQALFFLVWSCPTPVASATIRDLAGLCSP
jgi:butyryl-CoA dehydrogenase